MRARNGCPWDRKQTFLSLRPYVIEEAYEVVECLERRKWDELPEELGDLLYQVFFLAQIASERGLFDVDDVARGLSAKLIRRHPHVFGHGRPAPGADSRDQAATDGLYAKQPGDARKASPLFAEREGLLKLRGGGKKQKLKSDTQVLKQWAGTKWRENGGRGSVLDSVPRKMPALLRARRVSEKAARLGFDWSDVAAVLRKLSEELSEFKHEIPTRRRRRIESEFGDVLFTLVNVARFLRLDGEMALHAAIDRFAKRFQYVEKRIRKSGKEPQVLRSSEWDDLWKQAKHFST